MITHLDQVTEFPLCWPDPKPRAARRIGSSFSATMAKAQREIQDEMPRWHARGFVISMAPAYRRGPVDPGVAIWWNMPTKPGSAAPALRVLACDQYQLREHNLHAIALTLSGLRAFQRYGTYTLEQAVEGARLALPPPVSAAPAEEPWWMVLGVEPAWPLSAIEALYRARAEKAHPDRGGDPEEMKRLSAAIAAARKEIGES